MSTAEKLSLVSVEDYLERELISPIKHEYMGGVIHAMAGARNVHNDIAGNVFAALHTRLRGKPCRPYNSDTKVRIHLPTHIRFYYPDALVTCRPNRPTESFQDDPAVVIEVLSRSTRRLDQGEKKDAYLTIPRLSVYVLVEQETAAAVVFRRTANGFVREVYQGLDAVLPLSEIGVELPLADMYEAVEFIPEPEGDAASS
jgi:Uma2 family endonuclease